MQAVALINSLSAVSLQQRVRESKSYLPSPIGIPKNSNVFMTRLMLGPGSNPAHGDAKRGAQLPDAPRFSPFYGLAHHGFPVPYRKALEQPRDRYRARRRSIMLLPLSGSPSFSAPHGIVLASAPDR
jgi:hypothetical protein